MVFVAFGVLFIQMSSETVKKIFYNQASKRVILKNCDLRSQIAAQKRDKKCFFSLKC